jgi:class 3 adenylate cyclase/pimeloyl-ACP methyl ester carboxylesterase
MGVEIGAWLRGLGLGQYEQAFRDNDIDADLLARLTAKDLKEIGIASVGHRRRLLEAISGLRAGAASPSALPAEAPARASGAERRQLTVMFADLVGSTELSQRLDPEEMGELLRGYRDTVAREVTGHEGHVAKYMGDGVVCYFGWPRALEDAAERAVRAALALVAAVGRLTGPGGETLRCRVGLATGLVVAGETIGEGTAKEETVAGETPNLAARLQTIADPGAVVVAERTRRLLADLFEVADLGSHRLKGFARPIRAWRVVGPRHARSRFEALRRAGRTRLIGRARELDALERALRRAAAGRGQVVTAVGEAGVGKSRLFDAFLHAPGVAGWRVLGCGCHPLGRDALWSPVIDLVRACFGIQDQDDLERTTAKLDQGLAALGAPAASARTPLLSLLGPRLEDPAWQALNPLLRRRRILDAVTRLLLLESGRCPLVVLVEDLHWADGETVALLDGLVEAMPAHRLLLLVNHRPEFQPGWDGHGHHRRLRVDPLGSDDAAELLTERLGADPSLAALKRDLIARTAGNPLFLEELARDLAETGVLAGVPGAYRLAREDGVVPVPDTVQDILAARIDRLPREAKHVLQRAAVIGPNVPLPVLEAVADLPGAALRRRLDELQEAEMLHAIRPGSEPAYAFKHALTREVAYGGLLRQTRRTLHRRVGAAMEALYPDRLGELAEAMAEHFAQGEVWAKAARYALDAVEKAKARYAYPVALRFAERARDAAARDAGLDQEWIWANVLWGDLASLTDDLELANRSYDQALARSQDPAERRWIANKRHQRHATVRGGARIANYLHGGGEQTILFVSPIGYGLAAWQPIIERLCQEFRIVTVDLRGTGSSDPVVRPYTEKDHALDIAAVVHAASDAPVIGVGVSAAPNMLVRAAAADPALFSKLVLVGADSGTGLLDEPPAWPEIEAITQALAEGDLERAFRLFTPTILSEPGTEDLVEQRIGIYLHLPRDTVLSFFVDPRPPEIELKPLFEKIRVPTLVMHGTADRNVPFEAGRRLARAIPGAQLYAFEGRCHLCMLTAIQEFCDVLRGFARTGTVLPPDRARLPAPSA